MVKPRIRWSLSSKIINEGNGKGYCHSLGKRIAKKRIKQTPPTSKFKSLTSSQIRKLQKEN